MGEIRASIDGRRSTDAAIGGELLKRWSVVSCVGGDGSLELANQELQTVVNDLDVDQALRPARIAAGPVDLIVG